MKLKHTLSLLALAASAALSTSAMAQSQVTIIGEVGADICDITVNGTTNIRLPKISMAQIPTVGSTAQGNTLQIALANCDTTVVQSAQVNFSSPNARTDGRVNSGVNGVSLQVYTPSNNTQSFVTTSASSARDTSNPYQVAVSAAGTATLNYGVRYYREALTAATGQLNATLNLTVAYL